MYRKLLRQKARAKMVKAGFTNINRKTTYEGSVKTESNVQIHWREYC